VAFDGNKYINENFSSPPPPNTLLSLWKLLFCPWEKGSECIFQTFCSLNIIFNGKKSSKYMFGTFFARQKIRRGCWMNNYFWRIWNFSKDNRKF
jgi:hypothetical protein